MPDQSNEMIDKCFLLVAFVVLSFVALKPDGFIKGVTLGRPSSADVSYAALRTTQIIAGIAALSLAVSFVMGLVGKNRADAA